MTQQNEFNTIQETKTVRSPWLPALAAVAVIGGGFGLYESSQLQSVRHELSAYQKDVAALRVASSTEAEEIHKQFEQMRGALTQSGALDNKKLSDAVVAAQRRADAHAKRLEKEQKESVAALNTQLEQMKQSSEQASTRIDGVANDLTAVKGDVASTRSDLDKANTAMQSVRGDMGVMSGLIATNKGEIEELRRLGDRNIYEFTLRKDQGNVRVGDIAVRLAKVNVKRNRYTVVVNADDKTIEKRDKTTNEPVQFYVVSKARQPYELVVNEVGKDTVRGYLATPKVTLSRNGGAQ